MRMIDNCKGQFRELVDWMFMLNNIKGDIAAIKSKGLNEESIVEGIEVAAMNVQVDDVDLFAVDYLLHFGNTIIYNRDLSQIFL